MKSQLFQFPADQAVEIFHDTFGATHEWCGLIAVVAPTLTPGVSHVGIAEVDVEGDWTFISGPAFVKTNRVWKWLDRHDESWSIGYWRIDVLTEAHPWSSPAASLDHFIDSVTGEEDWS